MEVLIIIALLILLLIFSRKEETFKEESGAWDVKVKSGNKNVDVPSSPIVFSSIKGIADVPQNLETSGLPRVLVNPPPVRRTNMALAAYLETPMDKRPVKISNQFDTLGHVVDEIPDQLLN